MGVPPVVVREQSKVGGICLGTSKPRSFKLISLQAMLNSIRVILPSASVSAKALENEYRRIRSNFLIIAHRKSNSTHSPNLPQYQWRQLGLQEKVSCLGPSDLRK